MKVIVLEVMYENVVLYLLYVDGFFLMNVLWNWDLNFFFFKIRKVNIVILFMVLIIKNVFVEFIDNGLKKIKIYVIIIINRNGYMILFLMVVNVMFGFVCIIDELNLLVVVV